MTGKEALDIAAEKLLDRHKEAREEARQYKAADDMESYTQCLAEALVWHEASVLVLDLLQAEA